ncbi:permease [Caulobacter sp. Root1455]|uniref:LptF/LptG family permease n=1 Tax=unclassified Caulobacter TaxID=2648921 RepID=UPI0006FF2C46|nr:MULTISPECIES: LptF/LptG family permease [unclassified Caulobacter]KQY30200.1 permease [Caulobacter sp. Root487D2Y]KQY92498.1 permease [Caulobacter sp. Root1455]
MKIPLYVLRTVGMRVFGAAVILFSILQILDLLEVTTDILDRGLGTAGVLYYAALRSPRLIEQVAPIATLAGGLFAFSQLARESAIIAMRATGISAYRIVAMALPVAFVVMAVDFSCAQLIAPRTDPVLAAWWQATTPAADRKVPGPRSFRAGDDLVIAAGSSADGATLNAVRIYRRDTTGRLVERVEAPSASYARDKGWALTKPVIVRFHGEQSNVTPAAKMDWPSPLHPQDVQALFADSPVPTAATARRALLNGGGDRPTTFYETRLLAAFAGPVVSLVMLLLSAPVALANFRSGQGALLLAGGLAAGLIFLVVNGLLSALGEGGSLSPILAVWGGPVIFAALAIHALVVLEG